MLRHNTNASGQNALVVSRHGIFEAQNLVSALKRNSLSMFFNNIDYAEFSKCFSMELGRYDLLISDTNIGNFIDIKINTVTVPITNQSYDFSSVHNYITDYANRSVETFFKPGNFHKTSFENRDELLSEIYRLHGTGYSQQAFTDDIDRRHHFISFEKGNSMAFMTTSEITYSHPIFEVFINSKAILYDEQECHIFIFYHRGMDIMMKSSNISYLLKQFLHQDSALLFEMGDMSYQQLMSIFRW